MSFSNAGTLQSFELDQNTDYVFMVGTTNMRAVNIRIVAVSIDHSDIQSIEPEKVSRWTFWAATTNSAFLGHHPIRFK